MLNIEGNRVDGVSINPGGSSIGIEVATVIGNMRRVILFGGITTVVLQGGRPAQTLKSPMYSGFGDAC
jgi:hypothetical protein